MKKKNIYFTIAILGLLTPAVSYGQSLRIKGGLNISNMLVKDNDDTYSDDFKSRIGYQLGLTFQTKSDRTFSFEGGMSLATRGYDYSDFVMIEGMAVKVDQELRLSYLYIPLNAKATAELGKAKIYGKLGPYLGVGLKGQVYTKASVDGYSEDDTADIEWGNDPDTDDLKVFDGGVNIGAGIEIGKLEFGVDFDYGLANISAYTDNGSTMSNRNTSFTVAYKFASY